MMRPYVFRVPAVLLLLLACLSAAPITSADWSGGHAGAALTETSRHWFFAEGTTRAGFEEWVCVLNHGDSACDIAFRFLLPGGEAQPFHASLSARSRLTLNVNVAAGPGLDVSVLLEASSPVAAERAMYFRYGAEGWAGGHCEQGVTEPATEWLFAEGTTRPGFDTWLCISNPQHKPVKVDIDYLLGVGQGGNLTDSFTLGPRSRFTLRVNDAVPTERDVSLRVRSSEPVVAERPVYFDYRDGRDGGHVALGSKLPSSIWYFAEGTTRDGFEEWICLLNPGEDDALATLVFMSGGGEVRCLEVAVPAQRRQTVYVNDKVGPEMDVSCEVSSPQPLVAERAMYFTYQGRLRGGHICAGMTTPTPTALLAEGTTRPGFDEYVCILNPNGETASVQLSCMDEGGPVAGGTYAVGGRSRLTLLVRDIAGPDRDVSVSLSSNLPVVAERPMYFSYRSASRVTIAAAGDVNLDLDQFRQGFGYAYPWTGVSGLLQSADLAFCNLECAISYRGSPVQGKGFTFRGSPNALPALREAGIDVVSHANNHARDWGTEAFLDTLHHLGATGIARCGSGPDYAAAHAQAFLGAGGLRVAFLAYSDVNWPGWPAGPGYPGVADAADAAGMARDIAAARARADVVAVSFHWGMEKQYTPTPRQRQLAHFAVRCGADLVLGHHPHVVQGFEIYAGKLICYSLGNFVFNPGSAECNYSMLPLITMDSGGFVSAVIYPVLISSGRPQLITGGAATAWLRQIASLAASLGTLVTVRGDTATIP